MSLILKLVRQPVLLGKLVVSVGKAVSVDTVVTVDNVVPDGNVMPADIVATLFHDPGYGSC